MPLYEYRCLDCGRDFELLVSSGDTPSCPSCASSNLKKLLSAFSPSVASRSSYNTRKHDHPDNIIDDSGSDDRRTDISTQLSHLGKRRNRYRNARSRYYRTHKECGIKLL